MRWVYHRSWRQNQTVGSSCFCAVHASRNHWWVQLQLRWRSLWWYLWFCWTASRRQYRWLSGPSWVQSSSILSPWYRRRHPSFEQNLACCFCWLSNLWDEHTFLAFDWCYPGHEEERIELWQILSILLHTYRFVMGLRWWLLHIFWDRIWDRRWAVDLRYSDWRSDSCPCVGQCLVFCLWLLCLFPTSWSLASRSTTGAGHSASMRVVGHILWADWACKVGNQSCAYRVSPASAVFCVSSNPSWWAHLISETSWPSDIWSFGWTPHSWWPWWSTLSANHFLASQPEKLLAGLHLAKWSHCLQAYTLSVWFRSSSWICNNSRCRFCFIMEEGSQMRSEPCPSWGMGNRIRLGTLRICWTFRTAGY